MYVNAVLALISILPRLLSLKYKPFNKVNAFLFDITYGFIKLLIVILPLLYEPTKNIVLSNNSSFQEFQKKFVPNDIFLSLSLDNINDLLNDIYNYVSESDYIGLAVKKKGNIYYYIGINN